MSDLLSLFFHSRVVYIGVPIRFPNSSFLLFCEDESCSTTKLPFKDGF